MSSQSQATVFITGAGRGLGLGLAKAFAERGDRVIGAARRPEDATELAAVADQVIALDVSSDESIAAAATALAPLGRIDLLVNNAGIDARAAGGATDGRGPLSIGRTEMLAVMDVNVAGPVVLTQALLPLLEAAAAPIVVNISSQLGAISFGGRAGSDLAYNASKSALNMVSVRTAAELSGRGVTVVCLHPGWVQTDMGGSGASLTADESAVAIAETVGGLTTADSGRFLTWDGRDHDW